MDNTPFAETRAARLCSWILFAATSVCSAGLFLRVNTTQGTFRALIDDLRGTPSTLFSFVTHPVFLWSIPIAILIGFAKEILIRNKTRTMIWNGVHLILTLLAYSLYEAGLTDPLMALFGNLPLPKR
jgi:hypothetical protein